MTRVDLPISHGRLEALWQPEPSPRALALVCHPHPLYGGTMQNTATHRIARAWNDAGCSALRFNFSGVGGSTGVSGNGDGVPHDEFASLSAIRSLLASMRSPTSLIELEDSDHMATGRLDALSARLKQALERLPL
jgi:alpha/beta superfamily hydrolase